MLGNPILEMGIHAAKGELLPCLLACLLECVVGKSAVVAVIMFDSDATLCCKFLECLFCLQCFGRSLRCHEMNIAQSREVIDKDCAIIISASCKFAFKLSNKSCLR